MAPFQKQFSHIPEYRKKETQFKHQTSDCCGREELHFEETGSQADPGRGLQHEHVFRPLTLTWPETPWTYREPQRWVLLGCGLFQGPKYLPQALLGHSLSAANISVFLNFQLESYVLVRKQLRIALWKLASAIFNVKYICCHHSSKDKTRGFLPPGMNEGLSLPLFSREEGPRLSLPRRLGLPEKFQDAHQATRASGQLGETFLTGKSSVIALLLLSNHLTLLYIPDIFPYIF